MAAITRVPVPDLCCLWAETPTAPMNICLVGVFDGASLAGPDGTVTLEAVRSFVAARLGRAPMLRRVLRTTRLGEGTPAWIDAPRFDVAEHVVLAPAPQPLSREEDFLAWCAGRSVVPLDRSRPLWRMEVVPGLPDGHVGVIVTLHHVVADGLRGVAIISGLLDTDPAGADVAVRSWRPEPPPTTPRLVVDNLRRRRDAVRRARPAHLVRAVRTMRALSREPGRRAPSTSLTGPIGPGRRLVVQRYALRDVRSAAHAHGCTINELLLAAVTAGLRSLLVARGECRDGLVLRASVPVGAQAGRAGGMLMAPLPVAEDDPAERLRIIAAATRPRKQHADEGLAGIVAMPASLARLGVRWARDSAASHINLYVTNVPGPVQPLHLAGARLLEAVPLAPLVAGVRLSVTALSYDGSFLVSLLGDDNLTDLEVMAAGTEASFASYGAAAARRPAATADGR